MAALATKQIPSEPLVHTQFETVTGTWQYIVADPNTKIAVIIDSVLDFDPATATVSTKAADNLLTSIRDHGYSVSHILETHAHADHLTAARYLKSKLTCGAQQPLVCIGAGIEQVQRTFAENYGISDTDLAGAFDKTFGDNEQFQIGGFTATVLHLPGHTPDHIGYKIGSNVFTGDSMFNPDVGSARCDFPGGSPVELFASTRKLLALPAHFRLYTGHDYPPAGREAQAYYTVEEHRQQNKHVGSQANREDFIKWRSERDSQLGEPRLLHQALQVNIRGGRLPTVNQQGMRLIKASVKGEATLLAAL
ncbi:Metallo-hydrolase/oxidoreductase [Microthyrium microscopicum]|uniref:Metallo-hydrolase/oxidoreductase n=1 Tax=Microthyrium microscopicum TaxID=703497 RepID=A0A6A6U2J1_9PEZI|nr:Metallo-hydrolase/oxidoreductase [Microthyrium microscopicum]